MWLVAAALTEVGILAFTMHTEANDLLAGAGIGIVLSLPCSLFLLILGVGFARAKRPALALTALLFGLPALAVGLLFLLI